MVRLISVFWLTYFLSNNFYSTKTSAENEKDFDQKYEYLSDETIGENDLNNILLISWLFEDENEDKNFIRVGKLFH